MEQTLADYLTTPGNQGLLGTLLNENSIKVKDKRVASYVDLEEELVQKTSGLWGSYRKVLNYSNRVISKRLNDHNKALKNFFSLVQCLPQYIGSLSKDSGHLSEDVTALLDFGVVRAQKQGSFLYYSLQLRVTMAEDFMENDPGFFYDNLQKVTFFHDIAITTGEFSRNVNGDISVPESCTSSEILEDQKSSELLGSPKEQDSNFDLLGGPNCPQWDYSDISGLFSNPWNTEDEEDRGFNSTHASNTSSEVLGEEITRLGLLNARKLKNQSDTVIYSSDKCKGVVTESAHADAEMKVQNKEYVVSSHFSIIDPLQSSILSKSNKLKTSIPLSKCTPLVTKIGNFARQYTLTGGGDGGGHIPEMRYANMLSLNSRFGQNTYKSLLPDGIYEGTGLGVTNQPEAKPSNLPTDLMFSNLNITMGGDGITSAFDKGVGSIVGTGGVNPSIESGNSKSVGAESGNVDGLAEVVKASEDGLKDQNPIVRAHSFALTSSHEKLQEFLLVLKSWEAQSSILSGANRNSDQIYRDLKTEYSELTKTVDKTIMAALLADADKSIHLEQLKKAVAVSKNQCKHLLASLSDILTMTLGAHTDTSQFTLSMKALPKNVRLEGYSNPSLFCFIASFIEIYTNNPVSKSIYLPALYNELGVKNPGIMGSIKVSFNPQDYLSLFEILITRYASVPATLQSLLCKMDQIGRLENPLHPPDFMRELKRSTEYQNVLNIISNWIRVIYTFYPQPSVQNMILQGPHSSGMLSKLKTSFLADKISQNLVFIGSRNPAEQFGILVKMFTVQHDNLQAYVNTIRPSQHTPDTRAGSAVGGGMSPVPPSATGTLPRQPRVRFRDNTSVHVAERTGELQAGPRNPRSNFDFMDRHVFNRDLGHTFSTLVNGNLNPNSIPQALKEINAPTAKKLEDMGLNTKVAKFLAVLMVTDCKVCLQYVSANVQAINDQKIFLVPHFQVGGRRNDQGKPGYFAKVVYSCPTFLALDNIEKRKIQKKLKLCNLCLCYLGPAHFCKRSISCEKDPDLAKILCPCTSCQPFLEVQRGWFLEMQDKFISRKGSQILTNGGKIIAANHIMHSGPKQEGETSRDVKTRQVSANFSATSKRFRFDSFLDLKSTIKLDESALNSIARFSIITIDSEEGHSQAYILDSGASTSTSDVNTISKFYHSLNPELVSLKVATGTTSNHREFIVALPIHDTNKRLAVNFLSVDHKFDLIPGIGVRQLSDSLFEDYLHRCKINREKPIYDRGDFPDELPPVRPIGLLGIKDVQLRFISSHDGVVAYENIFRSDQRIILAGPLKPEITHSVNTLYAEGGNRTEYANVGQITNDSQSPGVPMSDSWNNKLGFRAKLITVKSDNFLCLLYATDCILSTTGNNLWSVPELEKMLNCYCIDNFGLLLKQSMEDQDFKDTGIERLTRGGKVICRDIQDYISLIKNTPFYRERFEILALSQILGATIKVWLSPDNVECFNNGQADILNLYLDMGTNHFSPIIHMAPKNGNYFPGGKSNQAHEFRLARHMEPRAPLSTNDLDFPPLPSSSSDNSDAETNQLGEPNGSLNKWGSKSPKYGKQSKSNRVKIYDPDYSECKLSPKSTRSLKYDSHPTINSNPPDHLTCETISCSDKTSQNNVSNVDKKSIDKLNQVLLNNTNLTRKDRVKFQEFISSLNGESKGPQTQSQRSINMATKNETFLGIGPPMDPKNPLEFARRTLAPQKKCQTYVKGKGFSRSKVQDEKNVPPTLPRRSLMNEYEKDFPCLGENKHGNIKHKEDVNWGDISWNSVKEVKPKNQLPMGGKINRVDCPKSLPRRTLFPTYVNKPPNGEAQPSKNKNPTLTGKSHRKKRLLRSKQHIDFQERKNTFPDIIQGVHTTLSNTLHCIPQDKNLEKHGLKGPTGDLALTPVKITTNTDLVPSSHKIKSSQQERSLLEHGEILRGADANPIEENASTFNCEEVITDLIELTNEATCTNFGITKDKDITSVSDIESQLTGPHTAQAVTHDKVLHINEHSDDSGAVLAKIPSPIFGGDINRPPERPNFFISIKINGKKIRQEIEKYQKKLVGKFPDLEKYKSKIERAHMTLLAFRVPDGAIEGAKQIFLDSLQDIQCFEILFEGDFFHFDEKVLCMKPSSSFDILKSINKKLFQTFTKNGFSCDSKFVPHTTIFQRHDDILPIKDMMDTLEEVKCTGGTEFVDKIELLSMTKPKAKDGYYFTECVKMLKVPHLLTESPTRHINLVEDTGKERVEEEQEEGIEVETDQDNLSVIRAIGHLLDLSQRPKDFVFTLKMDIQGSLGEKIRDAKCKLIQRHPEAEIFMVETEYLNLSFGANKVLKQPDPEIFKELISLICPIKFSYSNFEIVKAPGVLQYKLKDWATITDIVEFADRYDLQLISSNIPIISNINERTCDSLVDNDIEHLLRIKEDPHCNLASGCLFSYELEGGIERLLKVYGTSNIPTGTSIGEVWELIRRTLGDYSIGYCKDNTVLTLGSCVYMFQDGSAILYDLGSNLKHVKHELRAIKNKLEKISTSKSCFACHEPFTANGILEHFIVKHNLEVPLEIVSTFFNIPECQTCTSLVMGKEKLEHIILYHDKDDRVRNGIRIIVESLRGAVLRQDLGDLSLESTSYGNCKFTYNANTKLEHVNLIRNTVLSTLDNKIRGELSNDSKSRLAKPNTAALVENIQERLKEVPNAVLNGSLDGDEEGIEVFNKESLMKVLRSYIYSDHCNIAPCPSCPRCIRCKPIQSLTASEALERKLALEEPMLQGCIKLARQTEGNSKLRVVCRIPLDPERMHLLGHNEGSVRAEFDQKFKRLSPAERSEFNTAFLDMVSRGVFVRLDQAPLELQDLVKNTENRHFLSLAPSFKVSSLSTKCRCAVNGSKLNRNQVSLNDLTLTGRNNLDMPRVFRKFRAFKHAICSDVSKYYNATYLDQESIPFQLISYREGCELNGKWVTYLISRLTYGIRSAAFLSQEAMKLILQFHRIHCDCYTPSKDDNATIGGMSVDELLKVPNRIKEFNHGDLPFFPSSPNCNGAYHLFHEYVTNSFVDDLMLSLDQDHREILIKITDYCLSLFGFSTKGHDLSGQIYDHQSKTVDHEDGGFMSIGGYRFNPTDDNFKVKLVEMTNGTKQRGKVKKSKHSSDFFYEQLNSPKKVEAEYIMNLFRSTGTMPTLRLLVSRASAIYDQQGLINPLKSQLSRLLSSLIIASKGNWDFLVPDEAFHLYVKMIAEVGKSCFFLYPRHPLSNRIKEKVVKMTLLWLYDASPLGSFVSKYYFSYTTSSGTIGTHLIHGNSHLSPPKLSVPRCECGSGSTGSNMFLKIFEEYKDNIHEVIAGTDSLCNLYWCLMEPCKLETYVRNRCSNIVNCLKKIPSTMYARDIPDFDVSQGWTNVLFWFTGDPSVMTADIGTKYPLWEDSQSVAPLIRAEDVAPDSTHFLGPKWLQEGSMRNLWENNGCKSAAYFQRNKAEYQINKDEMEDAVLHDIRNGIKEKDILRSDSNIKVLNTENKLQTMRSFFVKSSEKNNKDCMTSENFFRGDIKVVNSLEKRDTRDLDGKNDTIKDALETGRENLTHGGVTFNYPSNQSFWLNKTIAAVFIILMVVFRAQRVFLQRINKIPEQILIRTPAITSFRNLCPVLDTIHSLVKMGGGNIDPPKYKMSEIMIFESEGGIEVLRMKKDIAIIKQIRIHTVHSPNSEPIFDIKKLCKPYPRVISIAKRSILGALNLAKSTISGGVDVDEKIESILIDFCFLIGFLSFNCKTNCLGGQPIISDIASSMAILCSCGLNQEIVNCMGTIQEKLGKGDLGILGTLPNTRLLYVKEMFLNLKKIYFHPNILLQDPTTGTIKPNLIHFFKNVSILDNTLDSVDRFLLVRSNLEVRKFCKDKLVKGNCTEIDGFFLVKNRISCNGDIPANLLLTMGGLRISSKKVVLYRKSPALHWIYNSCHRKAIDMKRPTNRTAEHSGLPTTSLNIEKGFLVLGGKGIIRELIEGCNLCKFRRQSFNKKKPCTI